LRGLSERDVPFVDVIGGLRDSKLWRDEVAADAGAPPGSAVYELVAELVLTAGWLEWLAEVY